MTWGTPRFTSMRTVTCMYEWVLQRFADVLGFFPGDIMHKFPWKITNIKGTLILTSPPVVFGLSINDNDSVTYVIKRTILFFCSHKCRVWFLNKCEHILKNLRFFRSFKIEYRHSISKKQLRSLPKSSYGENSSQNDIFCHLLFSFHFIQKKICEIDVCILRHHLIWRKKVRCLQCDGSGSDIILWKFCQINVG